MSTPKIFFDQNGTTQGPYETKELKTLARAGIIRPTTLVWKEGDPVRKVEAKQIRGLFSNDDRDPSPAVRERGGGGVTSKDSEEGFNVTEVSETSGNGGEFSSDARSHAAKLLADLKGVDFYEEVFPVSTSLVSTLLADTVFWVVMGLAAVPLLISTVQRQEYQLTAFALFFAVLWGVVFKTLIIKTDIGWGPLILALAFTGIIGMPLLLFSYSSLLPKAYLSLSADRSALFSLLGYVFQVGVCEELVKIVPVLIYLAWQRRRANPLGAILIGVFSGLGFAAFENMDYGNSSIFLSGVRSYTRGFRGAMEGTQQAMVLVLARSLSLVFCHAAWSGIFAYFVTAGFASGKRFFVMLFIGLAVSAVLHGVYDWLAGLQMTFATAVIVLAFVLFYAYLTKLDRLVNSSPGTE